jgi:uncharacterized protein YecE (DUF72 family)
MPRWGVPEWVGDVYPKGTAAKNFASLYMQQFDCIEFNATHYNVYKPERIEAWAHLAEAYDFKFCPKLFQGISHRSNIDQKEDLLQMSLDGLRAFGKHLGPIFIQLPEHFSLKRAHELDRFLKQLPNDLTFFIELRGADWFAHGKFFDWLRNLKIGALITDTPGRRDVVHTQLTIPKAFIRFVATGHPTDTMRLNAWIDQLKTWSEQGIEEIYFFIHCQDERLAPNLVRYVTKSL